MVTSFTWQMDMSSVNLLCMMTSPNKIVRGIGAIAPIILAIVCALAIFLFSAQNNDSSHVESDTIVSLVATATYDGFGSLNSANRAIVSASLDKPVRKVAHASEYALLGAMVLLALGAVAIPVFGESRGASRRARHARHSQRLGFGRNRLSHAIASTRGRAAVALVICFLYSCTDEFHQLFSAGRTASFGDCLIDTFGATAGILVALGIASLWKEGPASG